MQYLPAKREQNLATKRRPLSEGVVNSILGIQKLGKAQIVPRTYTEVSANVEGYWIYGC